MKYRTIYEKINPLGPLAGHGDTSTIIIEASDIVDATTKAIEMLNESERVKSVEGMA